MQIDFHHAVTYVVARCAGFDHPQADVIAYSAQYVDDATSAGVVCFKNQAMYSRISSAHETIDLTKNLDDKENHVVWLPFHFLPGNGGFAAGQGPLGGSFVNKIISMPDSPIAKEMVAATISDSDKPYSLHRLGIAMHVYADTWAHQGFAGVLNEVNEVEHAIETGKSNVFGGALQAFLTDVLDDALPPLGHARANVLPDMPFLSWNYENGKGVKIIRDNVNDFCTAADAMCKAMCRYQQKDPRASVGGIDAADMTTIRGLLTGLKTEDSNVRHQAWLQAIATGKFSFGKATVAYSSRGSNSWKAQALGTSADIPVHDYRDSFLNSNWKLFHDALQIHRLTVLHDILPRYGICAA
ncbi:MAG: hypothetical protein PHY31_00940 [Smithellaceae bacterium]|nr:hypothetical protein [Smithellaceae bacterium]